MAKEVVPSKNGKQNSRTVSGGSTSVGKCIIVPELEALAAEQANRMTRMTEEQRTILRSYFSRVTLKSLATFMKVSVNKVSREAQAMGLKR